MAYIKDGEAVRFTGNDLSPLQRAVRDANSGAPPSPTSHSVTDAAPSADAVKSVLDRDYYRNYDQRIADAWRNPLPQGQGDGS